MDLSSLTKEKLSGMKITELNEILRELGVSDLRGSNASKVTRIMEILESPHTSAVTERKHPVHGKYVKVIVNSRHQDIHDEFFADNHYACRIVMGQEVEIPDGFIKHIESAHDIEHYYDENAIDPESGKKGRHTQRRVQNYFVQRI